MATFTLHNRLWRDFGITDGKICQVDGSPNDNEYARWTTDGLEGRTEGEFKSDFNLRVSEENSILAMEVFS